MKNEPLNTHVIYALLSAGDFRFYAAFVPSQGFSDLAEILQDLFADLAEKI